MSALSISHCVCNSTSGNWIAWLLASGLPNGALDLAYSTERSMQNCAAPRLDAEYGGAGDPHAGERDMRVVGGHVEGPEVLLDGEAGGVDRHQEPGDALAAARRPAGPGEDEVVGGGPRLGEVLVQPDHLAERVDPGQARDRIGIYPVDPGQDLPETVREPGPYGRIRLVPQQPPRDRLPASRRSVSR